MGRITDLELVSALKPTDQIYVETADGSKRAPVGVLIAGIYRGVDITVMHAEEIAKKDGGDPWRFIKRRTHERDYTGLRAKDFIPFNMEGYTYHAQIAGIEPYFKATDQELAGHIDFLTKELYKDKVQFNTSNVNQGNATTPSPYLASNLKTFYANLESKLPAELSAVILNKRSLMESRYTAGQTLSSSTTWAWQDLGKLWAPHENEVFGRLVFSGKYAGANGTQYEIFRDGTEIVKEYVTGGRGNYWECDVMDGSSAYACYVGYNGNASANIASNTIVGAVVGFRIGELA